MPSDLGDPVMPRPVEWTPDLVARFWNGISATRLADLSFSRLAAPYLAMAMQRYLDPTKRILDFGCGDGDFIRHLLKHGFQAAAFEPSEARQATVRRNVGDVPGFLGFVGPGFDGPRFDLICMFEVIEHILDDAMTPTIATLLELLADDGLLVITTPNSEDLELNSCVDPSGEMLFHRWQHVRSFTATTLRSLLEERGLAPVVMNEIEFSDLVFASYGAGLAVRADYSNIFNTYRKLRVGSGDRIMAVMARPHQAALMTFTAADSWSRAPVVVAMRQELVSPAGIEELGRTSKETSGALSRLPVAKLKHESGYCWITPVESAGPSDSEEGPSGSDLVLYEDHLPLGPRHELHDAIRQYGQGRFSHWNGTLMFSTSDNSDPRTNGRHYRIGRQAD